MSEYYALVVRSQSELRVAESLRQHGFDCLAPVEYRWLRESKHAGTYRKGAKRQRQPRAYAMFVGYVFPQCELHEIRRMREMQDLQRANQPLIHGAVAFDGTPSAIPAAAIAELRTLDGADVPHYLGSVTLRKSLRQGAHADVVAGPFAGHRVTVQKFIADRACVLMEFLNSSRTVEVPIESLEAA